MAEDASSCQCPAGKTLYRNGARTRTGAYEMVSLRGQREVNAQWMMYCLAHNIGKIQRYGDIGRWKKERKAEIRQ